MKEVPVSLCIIAKNEEHCIADCINSVRHLAKELIVVDTGSTDQTQSIALQTGATVFNYCWHDDFAAARNFALRQAQGEWILILDADEILAPVSCDAFFSLLAANGIEGYYVKICSYLDTGDQVAEDYVIRLFRNKPEYFFEGPIHEQVAGSIKRHNAGNVIAFADVTIHHFGYLKHEITLKSKFIRNTTIIKKALSENPHDPFLHYSLGIEYLQQEDVKTAVGHLYQALTRARGDEGYFLQLLFSLILGLMQNGDQSPDDVNHIMEKALYMFPNSADLLCLQGSWLLQCEQYERAVAVLETAVQKVPEVLPLCKIYTLLGDACYLAGNASDAEQAYFSAFRLAPQELYSFMQILGIRRRSNSRLSWGTLSTFASVEMKRELRDALLNEGKYVLTLALALLTVLDSRSVEDTIQFMQVCNEYRLMLEGKADVRLQTQVIDVLSIGAQEMVLYAEALQNGWANPLWQLQDGLDHMIYFNLDMIVMLVCNGWLPNHKIGCKGAGACNVC